MVSPDAREGLRAIVGHGDPEPLLLEVVAHKFHDVRFVVDDEDVRGGTVVRHRLHDPPKLCAHQRGGADEERPEQRKGERPAGD